MVIFYSGTGSSYAQPECLLKERADIMLTFHDMKKGVPDTRFRKILEARERQYNRERDLYGRMNLEE